MQGPSLPSDGEPPVRGARFETVLVLALAFLAWALRMREPMASGILGAEDPYLFMERTWNLVQGRAIRDYPSGFMVLLAPFAWMGPGAFFLAARFMPPLLGAVAVVGTYRLCRGRIHWLAASAAALFVAVLPEHIVRTNLLFPTALDLALLPFLFLLVVRWAEGHTGAAWGAAGLLGLLLVVHPWAVALALPPLALFGILHTTGPGTGRSRAKAFVWAGAAVAAVAWAVAAWTRVSWLERLPRRVGRFIVDPASLGGIPPYVDFPRMLTWPILALAVLGLWFAWRRRDQPLPRLALLWTALLLPLAVVDWFGVWFIPHRTVAYMATGVVVLAALPVAEFARLRRVPNPRWTAQGVAALLLLAAVTVPFAAAVPPWYRIFDDHDYQAWDALDDNETDFVVAGSWQARAGYRALTGREAVYNPSFFRDAGTRDHELRSHPGLVVLIDNETRKNGLPTGFLEGWPKVGQWGDVEAYAAPPR